LDQTRDEKLNPNPIYDGIEKKVLFNFSKDPNFILIANSIF
jgi:hypothetical protein